MKSIVLSESGFCKLNSVLEIEGKLDHRINPLCWHLTGKIYASTSRGDASIIELPAEMTRSGKLERLIFNEDDVEVIDADLLINKLNSLIDATENNCDPQETSLR